MSMRHPIRNLARLWKHVCPSTKSNIVRSAVWPFSLFSQRQSGYQEHYRKQSAQDVETFLAEIRKGTTDSRAENSVAKLHDYPEPYSPIIHLKYVRMVEKMFGLQIHDHALVWQALNFTNGEKGERTGFTGKMAYKGFRAVKSMRGDSDYLLKGTRLPHLLSNRHFSLIGGKLGLHEIIFLSGKNEPLHLTASPLDSAVGMVMNAIFYVIACQGGVEALENALKHIEFTRWTYWGPPLKQRIQARWEDSIDSVSLHQKYFPNSDFRKHDSPVLPESFDIGEPEAEKMEESSVMTTGDPTQSLKKRLLLWTRILRKRKDVGKRIVSSLHRRKKSDPMRRNIDVSLRTYYDQILTLDDYVKYLRSGSSDPLYPYEFLEFAINMTILLNTELLRTPDIAPEHDLESLAKDIKTVLQNSPDTMDGFEMAYQLCKSHFELSLLMKERGFDNTAYENRHRNLSALYMLLFYARFWVRKLEYLGSR